MNVACLATSARLCGYRDTHQDPGEPCRRSNSLYLVAGAQKGDEKMPCCLTVAEDEEMPASLPKTGLLQSIGSPTHERFFTI